MKSQYLILTALLVFTGASFALSHGLAEKKISYTIGDTQFAGIVTWDNHENEVRPGILMVPNWMGPTEGSLEKAKKVAAMGYVVFMVDMYGVDVRPENGQEASAAAGTLRSDRELMRERGLRALEELRAVKGIPLDDDKIAGIGFCFGGGTVLELARAGVDLDAVISFHGDLASPTLESDSGNVVSKVLVLHGADDPYVPQTDVQAFVGTMMETDADWQLIQFSNTVHSFTNPAADSAGKSEYNPQSAMRSFEYMEELLEEIWGDQD